LMAVIYWMQRNYAPLDLYTKESVRNRFGYEVHLNPPSSASDE
jgi:hypothetical protein